MAETAHFIAADLGASGGRVMLGEWNGNCFSMRELHRFANVPVRAAGTLYWDMLGIWSQLIIGLRKYHATYEKSPAGIGIDAWGVDFGLLDRCGRLVGNPVHYRDKRTDHIPPHLFKIIPEHTWFAETGVQTMPINTLFQLYSMVRTHDPALESARTLLMVPDLFSYLLCGNKSVESSEASTTQMYSTTRGWARDLLAELQIPIDILPTITQPGTVLPPVTTEVIEECGFAQAFPAIAVASHDTASAVAAIPDMDEHSVFLSSGTWSLMGVESTQPDTSDAACQSGFTNEGGAGGTTLLLRNMTGLWILQECMRCWSGEAFTYSWSDLVAAADTATPFMSLIDPDASEFQARCDMPQAICDYCLATGQPVPHTNGEIARCAFESLSLNCRSVLDALRALTSRDLRVIRVVGGGARNAMLCQMTADACGCDVVSEPVEASALGNLMLQAIATREIADLREGREAIAGSVKCSRFQPRRDHLWQEAYARFRNLKEWKSAAAVS